MNQSFEEGDLIGKLTGYRCKECGCCLYFNNVGMTWCSWCNFSDKSLDVNKSEFVYVPVPDDHPHVVQFGHSILEPVSTQTT